MSEGHEQELLKISKIAEAKPCRCGNTHHSHLVSQIGEYTGWGWFWMLFGVTTEPKRVKFICRKCKMTVGVSEDKRILRRDI